MHFIVPKNLLYKSLQKVIGVIPTKTTIPVLENVLFELKENKLQLTGTDLEICISTTFLVEGVQNGSCTVPARSLNDILRELPDVPLEIFIDTENKFRIKTNKGLYKLVSQSKEEFPSIVVEDSEGNIIVDSKVILRMVNKTVFAVSSDELRPTLMGVFFQLSAEELKCVATDGHRLVKIIDYSYKSPDFQKSVIVPTKALSLMQKNLDALSGKDDIKVKFSIGENHVVFQFDETLIYSKIIEGQYPKFENVIPLNNDKKLTVNRDELSSTVKRISIFSNLLTHQIKFVIEDDKMLISSEDIEFGGEGNEEIYVKYSDEKMEIGYNGLYILDILKHIDTEEVDIFLKDSVSAAIVNPTIQEPNQELMMLIMPIRISDD